ncbi:MAG: hypothetical protein JWR80_8204 [Bradyrhizobium sp.]|nr:hypothetical protein [Bradyrhizobium sp.]
MPRPHPQEGGNRNLARSAEVQYGQHLERSFALLNRPAALALPPQRENNACHHFVVWD